MMLNKVSVDDGQMVTDWWLMQAR